MKVKGVIFDMDGVIIESFSVWSRGLQEILRVNGYEGVELSSLNLPSMSGMSLLDGSRIFKAYCHEAGIHLAQTDEELEQMRRDFAYRFYLEEVQTIEGFREFLKMLGEMGIKTCVGTAADPLLLQALELNPKVRLLSTFGSENVHCIGDVGFKSKPDPAIFKYSAARLDLSPDECVVIEDSELGVRAAKNGEFKCLGLRSHYPDDVLFSAGAMSVAHNYVELTNHFLKLYEGSREIVLLDELNELKAA